MKATYYKDKYKFMSIEQIVKDLIINHIAIKKEVRANGKKLARIMKFLGWVDNEIEKHGELVFYERWALQWKIRDMAWNILEGK